MSRLCEAASLKLELNKIAPRFALFSKMRQIRAPVLCFPAANRLWPQWTATFRVSAVDTNNDDFFLSFSF